MKVFRLIPLLLVLALAFSHGGPAASGMHDHVGTHIHHQTDHTHAHDESTSPDPEHESDGTAAHVHLSADRPVQSTLAAAPIFVTQRHWRRSEPCLTSSDRAPLLKPPAA